MVKHLKKVLIIPSANLEFFISEKHPKTSGKTGPPDPVFISMASNRHCRQRSGPSRLGATE